MEVHQQQILRLQQEVEQLQNKNRLMHNLTMKLVQGYDSHETQIKVSLQHIERLYDRLIKECTVPVANVVNIT